MQNALVNQLLQQACLTSGRASLYRRWRRGSWISVWYLNNCSSVIAVHSWRGKFVCDEVSLDIMKFVCDEVSLDIMTLRNLTAVKAWKPWRALILKQPVIMQSQQSLFSQSVDASCYYVGKCVQYMFKNNLYCPYTSKCILSLAALLCRDNLHKDSDDKT